ncbi:uncharacterized protein BYT42DRAFT_680 [Radiomyces spectabilis]|uniref:uncharacterized protein n=1 Tax=Radiomyces spectabilis TaxID=64574 RepID=UPI00221EF396|nr:uncharacterized protein BYT42DRAFT_680 [Radiomyces spectabilis]KAI8393277.1 hypothetical protein BYT42DRAFT_680 [Radiomyces spectabilis]
MTSTLNNPTSMTTAGDHVNTTNDLNHKATADHGSKDHTLPSTHEKAHNSSSTTTPAKSTDRPVNDDRSPQEKSRDEKLKMLEVVRGMRNGKFPTNQHMNRLFDKALQNKVIHDRQHLMSPDGQRLLKDFQDLLRVLKQTLDTKNKDELFQSMVYHLHCMDAPLNKESVKNANIAPNTNKEEFKQEAKGGAVAFLKIIRLILINGEFRETLNDLMAITQEAFGDAVDNLGDSLDQANDKLNESSQRVTQTDNRTGFLDQLTDKIDQKCEELDQPESLTTQNKSTFDSTGNNATGYNENDAVSNTMNQAGLQTHQGQQQGQIANFDPSNNENVQQTKEQTQQKTQELQAEARQRAEEHKQSAKQYAREKFPEEKQEQIINRLKKTLRDIQSHPEYEDAINTLIRLFKSWGNRAVEVAQNAADHANTQVSDVREDDHWSKVEIEVKTILEDWAQGQSLNPLVENVKQVMQDIKEDEKLRDYIQEWTDYIHRLLKETGYVDEEASTKDGEKLVEKGRQVVKERYRGHVNQLIDHARSYTNAMAEDPISKDINSVFKAIHQDLWFDQEGNPAFKPQLLNDMRLTLLPAMIEQIKYIPIPRIEYADKQFDVVVENVILSGDSLLPNMCEVKLENFSRFSPKSDVEPINRQIVNITMKNIQAELDDVVFYYKKKTGFPRMSDRGVAAMEIGGKGIDVTLKLHTTDDPKHVLKVVVCKAHVSNLKFKVKDSKHDLLYKTIHPMVIGIVRKQMAKAIELKILDMIDTIDQKLVANIWGMQAKADMNARQAEIHARQLKGEDVKDASAAQRSSQPQRVSKRPSLFSTLVTMINNNLKMKATRRAVKKKEQLAEVQKEINENPATMPKEEFVKKSDKALPPSDPTLLEDNHKETPAAMPKEEFVKKTDNALPPSDPQLMEGNHADPHAAKDHLTPPHSPTDKKPELAPTSEAEKLMHANVMDTTKDENPAMAAMHHRPDASKNPVFSADQRRSTLQNEETKPNEVRV